MYVHNTKSFWTDGLKYYEFKYIQVFKNSQINTREN